jgi:hypothetical protein
MLQGGYRLPTVAEKRAMMFHARSSDPHEAVNVKPGTPLKCFAAAISTVAPSSRWGAYEFNSFRYVADLRHRRRDREWYNFCNPWADNGFTAERYIRGRWFAVYEGSAGHVPVPGRILRSLIRGIRSQRGTSQTDGGSFVPPAGTAPPACSSSSLAIRIGGQPDGAAGTIYQKLLFTNTSSLSCTLRGSPRVSAVDSAGRQIGPPVPGVSVGEAVTVRPHETVEAPIGFHEIGAYPKSDCQPKKAANLRVLAPNTLTATLLPFAARECSRVSSIVVNAVEK